MRAIRFDRYGDPDVLTFVDLPEPTPGPGEVVVGPRALALNPKDVLVRKGKFAFLPGVRLPIVPTHDLAGVVTAVGANVDLAVGDEVYGWFESFTGGAAAERVAMKAAWLAPKPPSLSFEEAAALPLAALTALMALRDELAVRPGHRVAIHGASGGVGVFAIQIAKLLGAHVTAISSGRNRELCLELGADTHLDYTAQDVLGLRDLDAFFDVFGNQPWSRARVTLTPHGRYCTTLPRPRTVWQGVLARVGLSRAHLVVVRSRRADLDQLTAWVEAGRLRPVIDQILPWQRIADGHRALQTKRTRGKIVLRVSGDGDPPRDATSPSG